MGGGEIVDQLARVRLAEPDLLDEPAQRRAAAGIGAEVGGDLRAQARDRGGQLVAAAGRLAEPERDRGRRALRVLDPHGAALDAQDAVRAVAELEDVAGQALDREVLVDGADRWLSGSSTTW